MSAQKDSSPSAHLLQVLTFWDLVIYGLVYVSPVGPWTTFGYAYGLSGGLVCLVFAVGAIALSFTALSYARICTEVPGAGSAYAYARHSMGETIGFLTGWMILLDYLLIPALMYVVCAVILSVFTPSVPRWVWVLIVAGYNLGVNWFGVKTSARFNFGTLVLQFALLLAVIGAAVFVLSRSGAPMFGRSAWWTSSPMDIKGVFSAASLCVMAYLGFDAITTLSAEVKPDQRKLIGRAIIFSIGFLGILAVVHVWILSDLARGFTFNDLSTATYDLIGSRISPAFGQFVTWAAAFLTAVSITPPMVSAVSRVLYAMAQDGEMPKFLGRLHPKYNVPHMAILASGALSIGVALWFANQLDVLTSMVNFGALLAFIAVNLSVIALFVVRRKSHRWIVHLILPFLGVLTIIAVMTQMSGIGLAVGSAWLALGVVLHTVRRVRGTAPAMSG